MQYLAPDALARARQVRLVIFDVDGVLTDGRLWYGPGGEELKAFHAFDGHGIKLLLMAGLKTAILSGGLSIYKGGLKDNKGNTVIPAGTSYVITEPKLESMNYLVEGVVGSTS